MSEAGALPSPEPNTSMDGAHHKWVRYLKERGSTPERTRAAWLAMGEAGEPPASGFWAPTEGLPVFTVAGLKRANAVSIVTRMGLSRAPKGLAPVATYQSDYGVTRVFRKADLEPYRPKGTIARLQRREAAPRSCVPPGVKVRQAESHWKQLPPPVVRLAAPRVREVHLHIGPTNSGKTYAALTRLAGAERGTYLAPLRLLAWEALEQLEAEMRCPSELLTGEEYLPRPGARVVCATVEMLPPGRFDVVVVDEAQLIGNPQRGWAWVRALVTVNTDELHVCCAPQARAYLLELFRRLGDRVQVHEHQRLLPLTASAGPCPIDDLPGRSAIVVFSRRDVLRLKAHLEETRKVKCAAIYGALPPDVRREQAARVRSGDCPFVVATDAIGMGLNLPVDHVAIPDLTKFDGACRRELTPAEVRQIIGRAGRYGLSAHGTYGGTGIHSHAVLLRLASMEPSPVQTAYLHPSLPELEMLPGRLAQRLQLWVKLARPENLGDMVQVSPLSRMTELALALPAGIEKDLRLAHRLVTAPVSDENRWYWSRVVTAIARRQPLPAPPAADLPVRDDVALKQAEQRLKEHELCLWLMRHQAPGSSLEWEAVQDARNRIAAAIGKALAGGIGDGGCRGCGQRLPPGPG